MAEAVLVVIKARVTALVAHLDAVLAKHYAEQKYRHSEPPTYCADYISAKWCRVSRIDIGSQSVVAFVCLADFSNKQLGAVKAGDIHKPASWEKAAKHARGTVLAEDFGNCVDAGGHIHYLR